MAYDYVFTLESWVCNDVYNGLSTIMQETTKPMLT